MINFNQKTFDPKIETDPTPKDISQKFLELEPIEFQAYLRTLKDEPSLSITIN